MTIEIIDIIIREAGSRNVRRDIDNLGRSASASGRAVEFFQRALLLLGGGAIVSQLSRLADSYQNIQNQLRLVTQNSTQLKTVTNELFEISNRTRNSFEATSETFFRTAQAVKELGISQREVLDFTESLNQAVILSGASAEEAAGGLRQLSQGLASGKLSGDELRAVLESLPSVADVIAKSLGVTRGELRQLGADGKITAKVILDAFKEAREELADKFATTVPTIGQAFQVLENQFLRSVGSINEITGASETFARALLIIAENMDTLVRAVLGLVASMVLLAGPRAIGAVIGALRTLSIVLLTNPLSALGLAIGLIVGQLAFFSDKIDFTADKLVNLQDVGLAAFMLIGDALRSLADTFGPVGVAVQLLVEKIGSSLPNTFSDAFRIVAQLLDRFISVFPGVNRAIIESFRALPIGLQQVFTLALNGVIRLVESYLNILSGAISSVLGFVGIEQTLQISLTRLEEPVQASGLGVGEAFAKGFAEGADVRLVEGALDAVLGKAEELAAARRAAAEASENQLAEAQAQLGVAGPSVPSLGGSSSATSGPTFAEIQKQLENQNALLRQNGIERSILNEIVTAESQLKRALTDEERNIISSLIEENQKLNEKAQVLQELRGPQEDLKDRVEALNDLFRQGTITLDEYNEGLRNASLEAARAGKSIQDGITQGGIETMEKFGDSSQLVADVINSAFQRSEDTLLKFASGGIRSAEDIKGAFSNLANSILEDLTRIAIRQAIIGPLAGALFSGFGGGGAFGASGFTGDSISAGVAAPVPGFAQGGRFVIGGVGATDSKNFNFRASPGETADVIINKPGQVQRREAPMNINVTINTADVESFRQSKAQVEGELAKSIARAKQRNT